MTAGVCACRSQNNNSCMLFLSVQGGDLQWVFGRILEGVALEDIRVYLQILSKWRKNQDVIHQLDEVTMTVHSL